MDNAPGVACPRCAAVNSPLSRFCSKCGSPMPASQEASSTAPQPVYCGGCGSVISPGSQFCPSCGAPAGQAALPAPRVNFAGVDRNPIMALIVIGVICAAVSMVGWVPLSLPGRLLRSMLPTWNCSSLTPGSAAMYGCAAKVGALHMMAPLLVGIGLFLIRRPIIKGAGMLVPKLPTGSQFLVAPVLATICFAMPWSTAHFEAAFMSGIVPVTVFPAVVGLYTYATLKFGPYFQNRLRSLFDMRDRIPKYARFAAAIAIPLVISLLITNQERVTEPGLKEQIVVLISLVTGYLVLAPRQGSLLEGAQQAVARTPEAA